VRALVLPSPFLPELAYEPWVAALRRSGLEAVLAPVPWPPSATVLLSVWSGLTRRDTLLLPHSNAGYLAPLVSAAVDAAPIVFVDAALPAPGRTTRLAPTRFRDFLDGLADDGGLLPPWTRWWSPQEYSAVMSDEWFERIDAEAPHVPLSYVDEEVELPPGWEDGSRAYLAFGETYAEELDRAERASWPIRRLAGGHLHWLAEPEGSAAALMDLVRALGLSTLPR
jgi:hypothetical protein